MPKLKDMAKAALIGKVIASNISLYILKIS